MITWRLLLIAGVTLGSITAAAVAAAHGQEPGIPLAGALVVVALLAAGDRPRGQRWTEDQIKVAARARYEHQAARQRPSLRWCSWEGLPAVLRAQEVDSMRAGVEAAERGQ